MGDPRAFPSDAVGGKSCRHHNCMGEGAHAGEGWPTRNSSLYRVLMSFRLGRRELEVNRPNSRERAARTCRLCGCGAVEDEPRVLIECSANGGARAKYVGERPGVSGAQQAHHGD